MNDPWLRLQHSADQDISLLSAALLVAKDEYPSLACREYESRVDEYVSRLERQLPSNAGEAIRLSQLNAFLFEELGFAGDEHDYFDPRNSYLNEVLDRRLGNPISLAIVQITLAQRLKLPLEGVSFPGHFLVRMPLDGGIVVLDPFHRGRTLDLPELRRRARSELSAREIDDQRLASLLEPASHRAILTRMLRNLRLGYLQNETWDKALRCTDRIVTLDPFAVAEFRERGNLYLKLEHHSAARDDFKRYLALAPQAEDTEAVMNLMIASAAKAERVH
jgi:regulator of sirC expression with transglutaminase-like and TPR domain